MKSSAGGSALLLLLALTAPVAQVTAAGIELGNTASFALLALEGGSLEINSAHSIVGNVGYSQNVLVPNAQKVDSFIGSAYVYSGITTTNFNAKVATATYAPTGGIQYGPGAADTLLSNANADAQALQTGLNSLFSSGPVTNLGTLSSNTSLAGAGGLNLFDVTQWQFNSNTLTLTGGSNDWFVFRAGGIDNSWSQSNTVLNGVDPNHVLFYLTSTDTGHDAITVNKDSSIFSGTIFAPGGLVIYHNPATFNGRIIAHAIDVHSDFNISNPTLAVPEPEIYAMLGLGLGLMGWAGRRRKPQAA